MCINYELKNAAYFFDDAIGDEIVRLLRKTYLKLIGRLYVKKV